MEQNRPISRSRPAAPERSVARGRREPQPINISVVAVVQSTPPISTSSITLGARTAPSAAAWSHAKRLTVLNAMMTVFHFGLVLVTCFAGNLDLSAPVYSTKLVFTTNNETGFSLVPGPEYLSGFPMTVLTAAFFAISGTFHFGNATLWRSHYIGWLEDKKSLSRWIEYYLSASVMILLIGYATGLRSFVELFYCFFLVATTMTFGYLSDAANRPKSEEEWNDPSVFSRLIPHLLGYPPMIAAWVGLIFTLNQNTTECGPPQYVIALVFGELILFMSFGIPQFYQIVSRPKNYIYGEYVYQFLSLVAKGTLGGILLGFALVYDSFDESIQESMGNSTNCTVG